MLNILSYPIISFCEEQNVQIASDIKSKLRNLDDKIKKIRPTLVEQGNDIVSVVKQKQIGSIAIIDVYSDRLLSLAFSDNGGNCVARLLLHILSTDSLSDLLTGSKLSEPDSLEGLLSAISELPVNALLFYNCYKMSLGFILRVFNSGESPVDPNLVAKSYLMQFATTISSFLSSGFTDMDDNGIFSIVSKLCLVWLIDYYSYIKGQEQATREPVDAVKYIRLKYKKGTEYIKNNEVVTVPEDQVSDSDLSSDLITDDDVRLKDVIVNPPVKQFMGSEPKIEIKKDNNKWDEYSFDDDDDDVSVKKIDQRVQEIEDKRRKEKIELTSVIDEFKSNNPIDNKVSVVLDTDPRISGSKPSFDDDVKKNNKGGNVKVDNGMDWMPNVTKVIPRTNTESSDDPRQVVHNRYAKKPASNNGVNNNNNNRNGAELNKHPVDNGGVSNTRNTNTGEKKNVTNDVLKSAINGVGKDAVVTKKWL